MDFLKSIEPIVSFMGNLDRSETVGLIFGLAFLLLSIGAWCWICFFNGAPVWSNGIKSHYRKIGLPKIGEIFLFSPLSLKIFATIFLVCLIIGGILVGKNFLNT